MEKYRHKLEQLLSPAEIQVNGPAPWDIQIHNPRTYQRILKNPSLGAGESYTEGWWDCQALDELFFRITRHLPPTSIYRTFDVMKSVLRHFLINEQSRYRSQQVTEQHYDLDNMLYRYMLGESMAYTCAYWRRADTLDKAQYDKYDLICQKLELKPGETVLELGCGFGGFARFAATHYQATVTAINISREQMKYASDICQGLPIRLLVADYRDTATYNPKKIRFDKIVSIGLCEHIGSRNYRSFLNLVRSNLKETGLFLLHTIGKTYSIPFADPWIRKYIFPNGLLPSIAQLAKAMEGLFVLEDLHNFGHDYDKTLLAWYANVEKHWNDLKGSYNERFYRLWKYYLLSCAGGFRSRSLQLWQWVMSPQGKLRGYLSIR
ncbi:MAG: cyclopropane-fatty-acyl-phospholipid synthase [Coxiella sp. RIFCSPHIGHO2_12_FULL_44_14]|nr:MAG: cyclopropane-fatty-acyl-phospholipid synthase [Coxiella sp. RIFCSPHIGHO2_12_FULL_44_14]